MSERRLRLLACLLAFVVSTMSAADANQADAGDAPPNIIFILIDTLRADHVGCYGYPLDTTPTIDEIAAKGLVFTDAVAPAPWTSPSMASVFTSLYPRTHCVKDHQGKFRGRGDRAVTDVLADSLTTLAEGLREAGYATGGFVAGPWMNAEFGFGQGFDVYDDVKGGKPRSSDMIHEAALRWLRNRRSKRPFFLYLHYMEVHGPYNAPRKFRQPFVEPLRTPAEQGKLTLLPRRLQTWHARRLKDIDTDLAKYMEYYVARYDAGILHCDSKIAELRRSLESLGLWESAFVLITADHGEELGEHGGGDHGYNLHFHQLHVPLIIRTPWGIKPARIDATVSLLDVAPTLWEVGGADISAGAQGKSLVPMFRSPDQRKASFAFAEGVKKYPSRVSVQYLRRKLIKDTRQGKPRFYDLRIDPTEHRPGAALSDDMTARLEAALNEWLRETRNRKLPQATQTTIDPETEKLLRSLGYLGDD